MTTITLEVPDELANRLTTAQKQLPQVLSIALDLMGTPEDSPSPILPNSPLAIEVIDFLAGAPSLAEIITFKVSPKMQARFEELLDKNREEGLSQQEKAELETYQQVNHFFILLKARARKALNAVN